MLEGRCYLLATLQLSQLGCVLVRFNYVAGRIVNADHSMM
jgi:hypothetical protein